MPHAEKKTYAVLGAGMQGTAAAYDIARFGDPAALWLADVSLDQARKSAERIDALCGAEVCRPAQVDATDPQALAEFLKPADVLISAVPYHLQPAIVPIAIETGTSMVDLGNDTVDTWAVIERDADAKAKGVTLVPDTGLAPGLVNSFGNCIVEELDEVESIKLYCGGLPQHPKPPFNYMLVFSLEGLVGEYTDETVVLRDGEVAIIDTLDELETLEIEGLGTMEAFTTSGGTSTSPYTLKGRVRDYEYKTVRYPGHCEQMRLFKELGFWGLDPIEVSGMRVVPRDLFCKLVDPILADPTDKDLVVVRVTGVGTHNGERVAVQMDILEYHDDATGFSAMERLTGFSAAIVAEEIAHGAIPCGCFPYEKAMTGARFLEEIRRRGVEVRVTRCSCGNG
jgi:lysine 6-dehydrogenase